MTKFRFSPVLVAISAILVTACSGDPTSPTPVASQSASAATPLSDPVPGPSASPPSQSGEKSDKPVFTVTGPRDCVTAGTDTMQWVLNVADAGPSALRFKAFTHHYGKAGCDSTISNPRESKMLIGGKESYDPHARGQTTFTYDPHEHSCGRVQVDVSMIDSNGVETLLVGMVVNYGTTCTAPPPVPPQPPVPPVPPTQPAPLTCSPASVTTPAMMPVTFTATGGANTEYAWFADYATPGGGVGTTFTTRFTQGGTSLVRVRTKNAGEEAVCKVVVDDTQPPPPPPPPPAEPKCTLSVTPATVVAGQPAVITMVGENGTTGTVSDSPMPLTNGRATWNYISTPADVPSKTFVGTIAGAGGESKCSATLSVTPPPPPPPPCAPSFGLVRQGSWVIEESGGVSVKAIFSAKAHENVTAILHWRNGGSSYVKAVKSFSAGCTELLDAVEWLGYGTDRLPSRGAKYRLMLVSGHVSVGQVPQNMTVLASIDLN